MTCPYTYLLPSPHYSQKRFANTLQGVVCHDIRERGVFIMPKVGSKKFAYTKKGKAAAKKYAKKTKKRVK